MKSRESFYNIIGRTIAEIGEETERSLILNCVVSFSCQQKNNLMAQIIWCAQNGHMDRANSLKELLKDVDKVEGECKKIAGSNFHDLNRMSLIGLFSIVEASLEDAFSNLIENEGGVQNIIDKGFLKDSERNKLLSSNNVYDKARKSSKESFSCFHVSFSKAFNVNLNIYETWGAAVDELKEIKNCFLHRNGQVDVKLAGVSSRWEKEVGQKIKIDMPTYFDLFNKVISFLKDLNYSFATEYEKKALDERGFLDDSFAQVKTGTDWAKKKGIL